MIRNEVVQSLVRTGKWSEGAAQVAERARYKCEYCGLDLLASVEAYKLFEVDHIVPVSKDGPRDESNNHALSCRHCNVHYKRNWDPRPHAPENPTREQLIEVIKKYINEQRQRMQQDLAEVQRLVGYQPSKSPHDRAQGPVAESPLPGDHA